MKSRNKQAKKKKQRKYNLKNRFISIFLAVFFVFGLGLFFYPTIADLWNHRKAGAQLGTYQDILEGRDAAEMAEMLEEAAAYNEAWKQKDAYFRISPEMEEQYKKVLDATGTGLMGYVEIAKLHVKLPIYHDTESTTLQSAIGHLKWSALPVGGEGTHSVVSGHRGQLSSKLFADLDLLLPGDYFVLSMLGELFTYEVDQIRIVEPNDLSELLPVAGKDYCTLVTCTPYGVNTHRLLVRGHRVANLVDYDARIQANAVQFGRVAVAVAVATPIVLLMYAVVMVVTGRQLRLERSLQSAEDDYGVKVPVRKNKRRAVLRYIGNAGKERTG